MRTRIAVTIAFAALLAGTPERPAAQIQTRTPDAPRLLVVMVVDQMRADYIDRFQGRWTGGLERLVTRGARFTRAAYPYLSTYTCAGHATIATGAFPHTHGIVQNTWWDRERRARVTCTADGQARTVSYGTATAPGDSAERLMAPTLADVMRTERHARVVSLSLKDDGAIMLAGHGGDAVTWMTRTNFEWLTSSAFSNARVPAVAAYVSGHPVAADYGKPWNRLWPAGRYGNTDDGPAEMPPPGWTRKFPHVLEGSGNGPNATFAGQWQRSPFADDYLGSFAASLVESMRLGQGETTDLLAVSFSSPDLVGHGFGPDSQEIEDIYARLDLALGTLLDRLDTLVGRGRYTVALTADHGVTPIPEMLRVRGKQAGRLNAAKLATLIETQSQGALGPGHYVTIVNGNDVYFEPGMYAKLSANAGALRAVLDAIRKTDGIAEVYPSELVRGAATTVDPTLKAAALSYFPGRSGDLILVLEPGWMFSPNGTTHGSVNPDDQQVPLLFYGQGIRRGTFTERVTPADLAPTLAALGGVTLAKAEGRVLRAALDTPQQRPRLSTRRD